MNVFLPEVLCVIVLVAENSDFSDFKGFAWEAKQERTLHLPSWDEVNGA